MGFAQEFKAYCKTHGRPERIELMLCDMNAILRGKWLPADAADKLDRGEARLPLSTYAPNIFGEEVEASGLGSVVGDPDAVLKPIAGTLYPVPWLADGRAAQVLVEMVDEAGAPVDISPRNMLQGMAARFEAKGLRPVIASELEFYLFPARDDPASAPTPPPKSPAAQNYELDILERFETVLRDIQNAAQALDLQTDVLIAEYGPGQFEINFHHTEDLLSAADTAVIFQRVVRGVARSHGLEATFAAKPYADHPGNGMHLHASVLDQTGANIFDQGDEMGSRLGHAVAGCLATMADLQAIFAPHLNSYRRFQKGSFAPTAPDWALDDRRAGIRIPQATGPAARLEHRIAGADVNPYLAFTAILGGMLHGLETQPDLPLPLDHPDAKQPEALGPDWGQAVARFEQAPIARDLFGQNYVAIYSAVRHDERERLTKVITPMEYATYLGRI